MLNVTRKQRGGGEERANWVIVKNVNHDFITRVSNLIGKFNSEV